MPNDDPKALTKRYAAIARSFAEEGLRLKEERDALRAALERSQARRAALCAVLRYAWDLDRRMDVDAFYHWCERLLGVRRSRDPAIAYNEIERSVSAALAKAWNPVAAESDARETLVEICAVIGGRPEGVEVDRYAAWALGVAHAALHELPLPALAGATPSDGD